MIGITAKMKAIALIQNIFKSILWATDSFCRLFLMMKTAASKKKAYNKCKIMIMLEKTQYIISNRLVKFFSVLYLPCLFSKTLCLPIMSIIYKVIGTAIHRPITNHFSILKFFSCCSVSRAVRSLRPFILIAL